MHYHAEVVMPPQADLMSGLDLVLRSFNENEDAFPEDGSFYQYMGLWDYWVVGGRWSGSKLMENLGADKIDRFRQELVKREITVSGVQFGKEEISPSSQIKEVDELWRDWFPDSTGKCPLFKHSGDSIDLDVCKLSDVSKTLTVSSLFIAGTSHDGTLDCKHVLLDSYWNGCNHQPSGWDGKVLSGVAQYKEYLSNMAEDYRARNTPSDNWICVTIDYHS